jgi:hypothetical protein
MDVWLEDGTTLVVESPFVLLTRVNNVNLGYEFSSFLLLLAIHVLLYLLVSLCISERNDQQMKVTDLQHE